MPQVREVNREEGWAASIIEEFITRLSVSIALPRVVRSTLLVQMEAARYFQRTIPGLTPVLSYSINWRR